MNVELGLLDERIEPSGNSCVEVGDKELRIERSSDRWVMVGSFAPWMVALYLAQLGITGMVDEWTANISLTALQAICGTSAGLCLLANGITEHWALFDKGVTLNAKTLPILGVVKNPVVAVAVSQVIGGISTVFENPNTYWQIVQAMESYRFDQVWPAISGAVHNKDLLATMTVASLLSLSWAIFHAAIATGKSDPLIKQVDRFGDWRELAMNRAADWVKGKIVGDECYPVFVES